MFLIISGDMYASVPAIVPVFPWVILTSLAIPKSPSFTVSLLPSETLKSKKIFSGLMSLWISPASCVCLTARHTYLKIERIYRSGRGWPLPRTWLRSPPLAYSITMQSKSSFSLMYASCSLMMFGWSSFLRILTSYSAFFRSAPSNLISFCTARPFGSFSYLITKAAANLPCPSFSFLTLVYLVWLCLSIGLFSDEWPKSLIFYSSYNIRMVKCQSPPALRSGNSIISYSFWVSLCQWTVLASKSIVVAMMSPLSGSFMLDSFTSFLYIQI